MVMGEGRNITIKHLVKLGLEAKISKELIDQIIEQTAESLSKWVRLSKDYGVSKSNIELINRALIKL
jgi:serine/threonine-protein kinase HipA